MGEGAREILRTLHKAKVSKGLPKRTGKRGTRAASHGRLFGKKRQRTKSGRIQGVAVRVGGYYCIIHGKRLAA